MEVLNSPIELGVRSLVLLTKVFPKALDLGRLVLMDHCLLHSADLGGPESILPETPSRSGELGIKRTMIERGVQVMVRAGMVEVLVDPDGLLYMASEDANVFLELLRSPYLLSLSDVAEWVAREFGELTEEEIRERMSEIVGMWREQFAFPEENGAARPNLVEGT